MTLLELSDLATDITMRNRIKMASLKYADVLANRPLDTPGINGQRSTAKTIQQNPDQYAMQIQPTVVMDSAVQSAGANVTDEALQAAVETSINRSF
jgi:hypothetical protein